MESPIRILAWYLMGFVLLVLATLLLFGTGHAQTAGVITTPGQGLTFVYPGVGGGPTVIMPPTGPPSYYYPPAPMIQPVPTVPTVPTLPSLYAPAPAMPFGGF